MKYLNACKKYGSRVALAGSAIVFSGFASAEEAYDVVFSTLTTKFTALEAAAYSLMAVVLVALTVMKLVKKFTRNAT